MWRNGVSTSWRWVSANKGAEVGIHLADTGWQAVQCKCVVLRLGLGISLASNAGQRAVIMRAQSRQSVDCSNEDVSRGRCGAQGPPGTS